MSDRRLLQILKIGRRIGLPMSASSDLKSAI
jgi:hypothetical protein